MFRYGPQKFQMAMKKGAKRAPRNSDPETILILVTICCVVGAEFKYLYLQHGPCCHTSHKQ